MIAKKKCLLLTSCLFGIALQLVSLCSFANDQTIEIVKFFDASETVKRTIQRQLESLKSQEPETVAMAEKAMNRFDLDEISRRLGVVFEHFLGKEDIQSFMQFIDSPPGARVKIIFQEQKTQVGLVTALNALPNDAKSEANAFFGSKAMQRAIAAVNSDEARRVGNQYGEEIMCAYAEQNDEKAFKLFRRAGKCL